MVNLFTEIETDSAKLWAMGDALDAWEGAAFDAIKNAIQEHPGAVFLFAPGRDPNPRHRQRAAKVERLVRVEMAQTLMCLGVTVAGLPKHPSRAGYSEQMTPWNGSFCT